MSALIGAFEPYDGLHSCLAEHIAVEPIGSRRTDHTACSRHQHEAAWSPWSHLEAAVQTLPVTAGAYFDSPALRFAIEGINLFRPLPGPEST